MSRVAILISGRGSNMAKLIESCSDYDSKAKIVVVGSNNPNAKGLEYASQNSIPTFVIDHRAFSDCNNPRIEFDNKLHHELLKYDIDLICLAGFMRILSPEFISKYSNRILNIHPSLLPQFKGMNAIKNAIDNKAKISGCTTHFVTPEVDSGQIIMQSEVPISESDTYESLSKKIMIEEHKIYPLTLKSIATKIISEK